MRPYRQTDEPSKDSFLTSTSVGLDRQPACSSIHSKFLLLALGASFLRVPVIMSLDMGHRRPTVINPARMRESSIEVVLLLCIFDERQHSSHGTGGTSGAGGLTMEDWVTNG